MLTSVCACLGILTDLLDLFGSVWIFTGGNKEEPARQTNLALQALHDPAFKHTLFTPTESSYYSSK